MGTRLEPYSKGVVKPIMMYGSDCLITKVEPTDQPFAHAELIADLRATCNNTSTGVGLSANQIGVMTRVMIGINGKYFINPEIKKAKGVGRPYEEGCLSIPEVHGRVYRPKRIFVEWVDLNNEMFGSWFEGFDARVIQHEIDHLDGILFPDRMRDYDRVKIEKVLAAFESGTFPPENWDKYPVKWD